ncbi:hypothetical protein SAMN05444168_5719 [Paraburkholderia phenazinium]|uniref:Uncharacterized protein n=1 Tax=Paraburkholderia phenazinium TaxID=60549 RepID=A0A1N6K1U3_9BURK|nr:hypothetical protein SAMN05444168_5719 [Paraburkholderia phenazinium]
MPGPMRSAPPPFSILISPHRSLPGVRIRLLVPPLFFPQPIAGETHERSC